jgi:hypothetical protein
MRFDMDIIPSLESEPARVPEVKRAECERHSAEFY